MKTLTTLVVAFICTFANASGSIEWKGLVSINHEILSQKARQYISLSLTELDNVQIKLIHVDASYTFKNSHKNLNVLIMHSESFLETGEEQIVYVNDEPKAILMNKLQYIFIDFDVSGDAINHRIEEVPFNGNKQDFMDEFSGL